MTVWVGTSWKMNKTLSEAQEYARRLLGGLDVRQLGSVQPFIIPPATALSTVAGVLNGDRRVLLGAQNAHWEDDGAWTGEVSVPQAADAGAQLVEIGHSERRTHFGETDAMVRLKVAAVLRHGLTPLLCVGEPAEVKEAGGSSEFIVRQADRALDGLSKEELSRVLIAYEPVWAIGAGGRPAEPDELRNPFAALAHRWGHRAAGLLYGGSVALDNAAALLAIPHVNGLFVGRAAWQADGYLALLDIAAETAANRSTDWSGRKSTFNRS